LFPGTSSFSPNCVVSFPVIFVEAVALSPSFGAPPPSGQPDEPFLVGLLPVPLNPLAGPAKRPSAFVSLPSFSNQLSAVHDPLSIYNTFPPPVSIFPVRRSCRGRPPAFFFALPATVSSLSHVFPARRVEVGLFHHGVRRF